MKLVEIRDSHTTIPALAIQMIADSEIERYYLWRAGFPHDGSSIMLMVVYSGKATNDPCDWPSLGMGPRTMPVAHIWIINHFAEISDGDVVDVEYILGEKPEKKISERQVT